MKRKTRKTISVVWCALNALLAMFFLYLIIDAWTEIFFFRNTEKRFYYFGTLFIIPLLACLTVVFGWSFESVEE